MRNKTSERDKADMIYQEIEMVLWDKVSSAKLKEVTRILSKLVCRYVVEDNSLNNILDTDNIMYWSGIESRVSTL